jgi:hypothetical protein
LEWIEGSEAEDVVPNMPLEKQYAMGIKSGQILRGIHDSSVQKDGPKDWYDKYYEVIEPRIDAYKARGPRFDGAEDILAFIEENRHLLRGRGQSNIHGDYHLANLIINDNEEVFVIDWQPVDFEGVGDPWVDFINIGIDHPSFAAGQIDGYFAHQVPEDFWRMLALYLSTSAITSILWAKRFAPERLDGIMELNQKLLAVCHADPVNGHIIKLAGLDQTSIAHHGFPGGIPPLTFQRKCTVQNIAQRCTTIKETDTLVQLLLDFLLLFAQFIQIPVIDGLTFSADVLIPKLV